MLSFFQFLCNDFETKIDHHSLFCIYPIAYKKYSILNIKFMSKYFRKLNHDLKQIRNQFSYTIFSLDFVV